MVKAKEVPRDEIASTNESVRLVEDMRFFLLTAPANWLDNQIIRRYCLNNEEGYVSCVRWNGLYFITGTDIVRCIMYKFHHFGRTITDRKKFEEGVFLDLRNLRVGNDAILENPKLELLDFLHKNQCIRTQKKQKVFFWFNVAHDKLMADALERDIKRERLNQTAVSMAQREPALSFNYDAKSAKTLEEQLADHLAEPRFRTGRLNTPSSAGSTIAITSCKGAKKPELKRPTTPIISQIMTKRVLDSEPVEEFHLAKKSRHEITEDDFPLDHIERAVLNPPSAHEQYPQEAFYPPFYGHSPGYYQQAGFVPFLESPINLIRNDDYVLERSPLPKFSAVPIQMLIPHLASDNHAFPLLPPLSAIPGIWSSYGAHFPLLASDSKAMFEGPIPDSSVTHLSNSFEIYYQNGIEKQITLDEQGKSAERAVAKGDNGRSSEIQYRDVEKENKIPTPDSAKITSEV